MADDPEIEREVLEYGVERSAPLRRRDSSEYYREPPAFGRITLSYVVIWIISFVVLGYLFLWFLGRYWSGAWR